MQDIFELPAELTIYSALETRDALLLWVNEQTSKSAAVLKISASAVEAVDGSGLQLLAALSNMDVHWQVVASSSVFAEGCRTLGLAHWLGSADTAETLAGGAA